MPDRPEFVAVKRAQRRANVLAVHAAYSDAETNAHTQIAEVLAQATHKKKEVAI